MAKYPVLRRLLLDGETHEPGAVVDLGDEVADDLPAGVLGDAIVEADPKKKGGEKPSST